MADLTALVLKYFPDAIDIEDTGDTISWRDSDGYAYDLMPWYLSRSSKDYTEDWGVYGAEAEEALISGAEEDWSDHGRMIAASDLAAFITKPS